MGRPAAYDPTSEVEYLVRANLKDAEADEVLSVLASTYDSSSDRLLPGTHYYGPRVLDFAPILVHEKVPLNDVFVELLACAESALDEEVEIEFAVTLEHRRGED